MTVCQDVADSLDEGVDIDAIIINSSKAFDLVPRDWLLMKLAALDANSRVVMWVREFLVGRTKRVRLGRQLLKEVKVISGLP
jgi:predicted TIM-barrel enzyme